MATVRMADFRKRDIVQKATNKWEEVNPEKEYDSSVGDALYTEKLSKNIEKYEVFMKENFPKLALSVNYVHIGRIYTLALFVGS